MKVATVAILTVLIVAVMSISSSSGLVGPVAGVGFSPGSGAVSPPVSKLAPAYDITFEETGLSSSRVWSVTLAGVNESSTTSNIVFPEENGTYSYSIVAVGYYAFPATGKVTMEGSAQTVSTEFTAIPITHVVVIVMENGARPAILSKSPYQRYLEGHYGSVPDYYALCHQSPPNYFAFTSGRTSECGSVGVENVANIPDSLQAASLTWHGYFESMPTSCDLKRTSNGLYVGADHNPFLSYKDIRDNTSRCQANVVNSNSFNVSVASGNLPSFSFYIPNEYDDCHTPPPGLTNAQERVLCDDWLKGFLAPMLNHTMNASGLNFDTPQERALINHTAFIIVYDEGAGTSDAGYTVDNIFTPYCYNHWGVNQTTCGGLTYISVVSPYSVGTTFVGDASDMNVASTIEWLLGVGSDGGLDGTPGLFPAFTSLFDFPT
ncbi:MAG: alkaline phosphatase family protein [Thermoplasmata archaeon]